MAIIIFSAGALALFYIAPHDLEWLHYFADHQVDWFNKLMSESLFELEKPGAGDIVVIFFTVSLLLYCAASLVDTIRPVGGMINGIRQWLLKRARFSEYLRRHRLQLEFLVVSSFCCSTLMVKTLKWVMARPRPTKILRGTRDFYQWYDVGPYFLDEGGYRASFPSGHTASAITLIGLAYVLIYTSSSDRWRTRGKIIMAATLCFTIAMAAARTMTAAHWPTDVIFSIFGGWLIIHLLFFYGYQFSPVNDRYLLKTLGSGSAPPFRGLRICWYLSWICLSGVAMILGLRHYFHDRWPWLILVCIPALPLFLYCFRKVYQEKGAAG